jgi:hypothetical protein
MGRGENVPLLVLFVSALRLDGLRRRKGASTVGGHGVGSFGDVAGQVQVWRLSNRMSGGFVVPPSRENSRRQTTDGNQLATREGQQCQRCNWQRQKTVKGITKQRIREVEGSGEFPGRGRRCSAAQGPKDGPKRNGKFGARDDSYFRSGRGSQCNRPYGARRPR